MIPAQEAFRPWKLATLLLGTAMLVVGAFHFDAPDWDVPVSFIMAVLAYLTAPWALRIYLDRRWAHWPLALFVTWFTVDGSYAIYWHFTDPAALDAMRAANFFASLSLYGACGVIWLWNGSLRVLYEETAHVRV
jgi:hypothetical protein